MQRLQAGARTGGHSQQVLVATVTFQDGGGRGDSVYAA